MQQSHKLLPDSPKKKGETMRIIDFIAGTTDSYATQMASEITGRSSPLYTFSPETGLN